MEESPQDTHEHRSIHKLPPQHPETSSHVTVHRLDLTTDLILSATILSVTLVGIIFVLVIFLFWWRNRTPWQHKDDQKMDYRDFDKKVSREPPKIVKEASEEEITVKYIEETETAKHTLVTTRNYGGSSPKVVEQEKEEEKQFVFPPEQEPQPGTSRDVPTSQAKLKIPLPEQTWLSKKSFDCKPYRATIPRQLAEVVKSELGDGISQDKRKKFSATRSPSLEKDDKSPFVGSAAYDKSEVFEFDTEKIKQISTSTSSQIIEIKVQPRYEPAYNIVDRNFNNNITPISPNFPVNFEYQKSVHSNAAHVRTCSLDAKNENKEKTNLRRFRSVNTKLNICSTADIPAEIQQEICQSQNSPTIMQCSSATDKTPRFSFSPKLLSENQNSPKFFTPTDKFSPRFFPEGSPKSVYYDSVRSPKFFPDTPKSPATQDDRSSLSPKPNTGQSNRNSPKFLIDQLSPRMLQGKPRSPKIHSFNKENYFNFSSPYEISTIDEVDNVSTANKPKNMQFYAGRKSIERDRVTTTEKIDVRKYRRHNSCDTYSKSTENEDSTNTDTKKIKTDNYLQTELEENVSDICIKVDSIKLSPSQEENLEHLSSDVQTVQQRRQRLKSISLDSDNAKVIEQNLGLPIVKHIKQDNLNEALQEYSSTCTNVKRSETCEGVCQNKFTFEQLESSEGKLEDYFNEDLRYSPDLMQKKSLRDSSNTQSFLDMPRFSPKEFEVRVTDEDQPTTQKKKNNKNVHNLTIDLSRRDSDLEKELLEFEKLYCTSEEKKVKTPTLKVKATSLDSSESMNLSLPQKNTLDVPQNSVSVPNTPKRQYKRILAHKCLQKNQDAHCGGKLGYNSLQSDQKRFTKWQPVYLDSGIFLKENHANLMLYQPSCSNSKSWRMCSFDENIAGFAETPPEISVNECDSSSNVKKFGDSSHLGSNLLNFKQNLSVSSTNLKTLPEGVPSNDFDASTEEKVPKKLNRRGSNQSLKSSFDQGKYSTLSLQSSNCSLSSAGLSCHNLSSMRNSASNYSLNTDNRQKLLERRNSNTLLTLSTDHLNPLTKIIGSSNTNLQPTAGVSYEGHAKPAKNCLLQRRGSNNSLTLNLQGSSTNLNRFSSNSSLNINKDAKSGQRKGLLERRSSNTSLTLNINTSNPQLSTSRGLSISNYNLNGSSCNLSLQNSNQSISQGEVKKGILERRSSNTSLTINIQSQEVPRAIEVDEKMLQSNFRDQAFLPQRDRHRKSLSTENLIPKSYKNRNQSTKANEGMSFGSHDDLWSNCFVAEAMQENQGQNLTFVGGDQENEIIYALGAHQSFEGQGMMRNITTKPLSPQTTSEEFKTYLANIQHLQNASSVLTRKQLKYFNNIFQNGYSDFRCDGPDDDGHRCTQVDHSSADPLATFPDADPTCSEQQKSLLRSLYKEFWDLPCNFQEKPMVFGSHPKNRYKTILPNEHSRVIVKSSGSESGEGYVNANFIKGHDNTKNSYIATQGPLVNTIYDFWLMVHQNSSCIIKEQSSGEDESDLTKFQKIVMLTSFMENNRQKCEKYFPVEVNEEVIFENPEDLDYIFSDVSKNSNLRNSFTITNRGVVEKTSYSIRKLLVCYKHTEKSLSIDSANIMQKTENILVYHYWFHNWADHKCPKDINALLNFTLDVLNNRVYELEIESSICKDPKKSTSETMTKFLFPPNEEMASCDPVKISGEDDGTPPTIVHCSAGIGRTGSFIAILNGIKQLSCDHQVDILGIVCNMRLNRGGMVQNSEQYELVHKVLCLFEHIYMPASVN